MDDERLFKLQERINELEKRVDFLYDQMNIPRSMDMSNNLELITAIQRGDKIEAIKIYRTHTKCDLSAAKTAVEGMWNLYH